jgi:hypothetical protein
MRQAAKPRGAGCAHEVDATLPEGLFEAPK